MRKIVTFGEIKLRLAPLPFQRFQPGELLPGLLRMHQLDMSSPRRKK